MLGKLQRLGLCVALCALSACEVWLDVEAPQCETSSDCVGRFGRDYTCATGGVCIAPETADAGTKHKLPTRWACANTKTSDFIDDPDQRVAIRMDAVDLQTLTVPDGITADACTPNDFDCKAPVQKDVKPGVDGYFQFDLAYGFEGLIRFSAPTMVTGVSKTNRPYLESSTTSGPALLTDESRNDLAEHSGYPTEPGTAIAILELRDCADLAGDGISYDPVMQDDELQQPFYFDGSLPSRTLTSTRVSSLLASKREPRAVAGFSNLKPGFVSFTARLPSTGDAIATVTIPLFAEAISYVRIYAGY